MTTKIIGIAFCAAALAHGCSKYFAIRKSARHVYNNGGVRVMDFVFLVPLWLAVGVSMLLKRWDLYPFPFFGVVLYFLVAVSLYSVMELEYKLGKPEVERQLAEIAKSNAAARSRANDASKSSPGK
jgi:hypothetical protein